MNLKAKDYNSSKTYYGPNDYNLFNDINDTSVCSLRQRKLETKNPLSIGLPSQELRFFTDFIPVPLYNKIFIIRNDHMIYQVEITIDSSNDYITEIR